MEQNTPKSSKHRPKIIAFYLPQFHSFPENDAWWGKGFTEWTNVRKSKPFFPGHIQPEVPLGGNYYSLLDPAVQVSQAKLAQKYCVDGFCYYHYWFSGKLLMEKPMENMLANPEVTEPFCICWANEHWSRNWDGQNKKVIMPQNYDETESAWAEHFQYLLPFFRDPRYICHEGKPVFIVYKPYLMKNPNGMVKFWQKLAREAGLPGLYVGYQDPNSFLYDTSAFDFGIEFEPNYTNFERGSRFRSMQEKLAYGMKHWPWLAGKVRKKVHNLIRRKVLHHSIITDYDETWQCILKREPMDHVMPGAFTAWDNTPRRGVNAGVFYEATPEKFHRYMAAALQKAQDAGSEFFFINAWNEWGEGAHLEPDEHNGYGYLEGVYDAVHALHGKDES